MRKIIPTSCKLREHKLSWPQIDYMWSQESTKLSRLLEFICLPFTVI